MWTSILLGFMLAAQAPAAPTQTVTTGTIGGRVTTPAGVTLNQPIQVVLLPPEYAEVWNTDVQERLDNYWEQYKPTFIQQKELFLEVQKMAYRASFQFVVTRMQFDNRGRSSGLIHEATPDGRFEFRNVPAGLYKILAMSRTGNQEIFWSDLVRIAGADPIHIELKKTIP